MEWKIDGRKGEELMTKNTRQYEKARTAHPKTILPSGKASTAGRGSGRKGQSRPSSGGDRSRRCSRRARAREEET